ncbi:uncharacterized protein B0H18DRAFT_1024907 [Fomitopsis serialis]|uniref:uncharacterized protein n=1 Tax=Fomitopsis serialis TaxID=139415 RepID=UPI0020087B21|nr:uncharacterized protein B0H18DRAFT_1024907 [Neoantrodia serialis]KAH9920327.1 hypothetical protein B0H18DRAFT_1024907 [Neoantrodia serialis]
MACQTPSGVSPPYYTCGPDHASYPSWHCTGILHVNTEGRKWMYLTVIVSFDGCPLGRPIHQLLFSFGRETVVVRLPSSDCRRNASSARRRARLEAVKAWVNCQPESAPVNTPQIMDVFLLNLNSFEPSIAGRCKANAAMRLMTPKNGDRIWRPTAYQTSRKTSEDAVFPCFLKHSSIVVRNAAYRVARSRYLGASRYRICGQA